MRDDHTVPAASSFPPSLVTLYWFLCRSKCAINGGTFILKQNIDEILFDNSGRAVGVRCGSKVRCWCAYRGCSMPGTDRAPVCPSCRPPRLR